MVESTQLSWLERGLLVLVLVVSLLLRVTATDVFGTPDEVSWHDRSLAFSQALSEHQWQDTYQSGHPGVLTMWIGTISERSQLLQRLFAGLAGLARGLMRAPAAAAGAGLPPLTVGARGLVALLTWLGIIALFPLLRRLFGERTAAIATALIALDPFLLAHSRLHHLDALLTVLMALSIGCLLVYTLRGRQIPYLIASASAAALATANKSPGVLLAPWAGAALLLPVLSSPGHKRCAELRRGARDLALWGAVMVLVFVAVWPAMWVNPLGSLRNMLDTAELYAGSPHENSNFFWFAERPDPGPLFYPVAWAFRATPWIVLGLVALAAFWRKKEERAPLALLGLATLLFAGAMTVGEKKFDRYLLPLFPLVDIAAAVGWVALYRRWRAAGWRRAQWVRAGLLPLLALGQFLVLWPTRPYYLSYYNPLLGGGKAASRVLLVGWGEVMDKVAGYLNAKPDAQDLVVGDSSSSMLEYLLQGKRVRLGTEVSPVDLDYYVLYSSVVQRHLVPQGYPRAQDRLEFVAVQNGIEYAWVYRNGLRQEVDQVLDRIAAQEDPSQGIILLDADAALGSHYQGAVPLHVVAPAGREDSLLTSLQKATTGYRHVWRLTYPGQREISLALTQRFADCCTIGDEISVGSIGAVRYDLPSEPPFLVPLPSQMSAARFGEQMTLLGYSASSSELAPGQPLSIRLYWQADAPVTASYTVFVQLVDQGDNIYGQLDSQPQDGLRQTSTWETGETILDDHELQVAADAPEGDYSVLVGMYDLNTMERVPAFDSAGQELPHDALRLTGFRVASSQ